MKTVAINLPVSDDILLSLDAGDRVVLSGDIYTLRDAGHKRLVESIKSDNPDWDCRNKAIYYCGPTPTLEGEIIGSCGPTTSSRMDDYAPTLIKEGLKIMIGKGKRNGEVLDAMKAYGAVYLIAVGGAGALYKSCVTANEPVLYDDLGCEALRKLTVKNMVLLVGADAKGKTVLK